MVTDDEVKRAAKAVIFYKGYPYSQTEFNFNYYNAISYLKDKGATSEQIREFAKLVHDAPIRGGHFNSYSGD
ncbi:MAG: hypothetical protein AAB454_01000 [Patescibacteria group bacterium]